MVYNDSVQYINDSMCDDGNLKNNSETILLIVSQNAADTNRDRSGFYPHKAD